MPPKRTQKKISSRRELFLSVVVDDKEKEQIAAAAKREGRSLSQWCRQALLAAADPKRIGQF